MNIKRDIAWFFGDGVWTREPIGRTSCRQPEDNSGPDHFNRKAGGQVIGGQDRDVFEYQTLGRTRQNN